MCVGADYLEHSDNGPEEGVEVLPVRDRVPRLRLETELTAEDVHAQDTATQQHSRALNHQINVTSGTG